MSAIATAKPMVSNERFSRLGLLQEPAGYVDGPSLYEYIGGNPLNRIDPSGTVALANAIRAAGATTDYPQVDLRVTYREEPEIQKALSPYAVRHGVELALQALKVAGVTNLPADDVNFTRVDAKQFATIKGTPGVVMFPDATQSHKNAQSIDLGNGYYLKFYDREKCTEYDVAVVHKTDSWAHKVDFLQYKFTAESNGSIAEEYGAFVVVNDKYLKRLGNLSKSALAAFNKAYPNQYQVPGPAATQPSTVPSTQPSRAPQ